MATTTYPLSGLSLLQPFASAVAFGHKKAENRDWRRLLDGPIWVALHAGKDLYTGAERIVSDYRRMGLWPDPPKLEEMPRSAILGAVRIDEVLPYSIQDPSPKARPGDLITNPRLAKDLWAFGPWCWMVGEVRLLDQPIPCRGMPGLFPLWSEKAAREGRPNPSQLTKAQVEQIHALTRRWSFGLPPRSGWYEIEGYPTPVLVTRSGDAPPGCGGYTWQRTPEDDPEALSEITGMVEGGRGWRVPGPKRAINEG